MIFVLVGSRSIWLLSVLFLLPFCYKNITTFSIRFCNSYPLLLILIWCFLSSFWSYWSGFVRVETFFQLLIFLTTLLISELYSPKTIFKVLHDISVLCITLVFISLILSPSNLSNFVGIYAHKNTTGQFLGICTLILAFTSYKVRSTYIMICIGVVLLLLTRSATSIATFFMAVSIGYMFFTISNTSRAWLYYLFTRVGYLFLFLFYILIYSYNVEILDFIYNNLADEDLTGRGTLWKVMLYHAEEQIVKGFGYASVWWHDDYSEVYFTELAIQSREWVDKLRGSDGGYVDIVLSIGLIGLFLFITFLYTMFVNLLKVDNANNRALLLALTFMLATFGITESIFLVPQNALWFLLLLIFCISLSKKDKTNYVC